MSKSIKCNAEHTCRPRQSHQVHACRLENHEHLQTTTRIPVQRLQHFCKPLVSSSMNCTQLASRRAHGSPPRCSLGSTGQHAQYVTRLRSSLGCIAA